MFTAKVYRVLVKSAGNTQEEHFTALKVLEDWNTNQGEKMGKVFISFKPTNDQYPLPEVDILIGIVGSFISDQDLFKAYVDAGKRVLLFFNTVHDAINSMQSEVQEVEAFKKQMGPLCSCLSYDGATDFADVFRGYLDLI